MLAAAVPFFALAGLIVQRRGISSLEQSLFNWTIPLSIVPSAFFASSHPNSSCTGRPPTQRTVVLRPECKPKHMWKEMSLDLSPWSTCFVWYSFYLSFRKQSTLYALPRISVAPCLYFGEDSWKPQTPSPDFVRKVGDCFERLHSPYAVSMRKMWLVCVAASTSESLNSVPSTRTHECILPRGWISQFMHNRCQDWDESYGPLQLRFGHLRCVPEHPNPLGFPQS